MSNNEQGLPRFNVHMISRIADIDVQIAAMPAESAELARQNAPQWMARPEVWLVTDVRKV